MNATCDLAFAVAQLVREECRIVKKELAVNADLEVAFAVDDDDLVEWAVKVKVSETSRFVDQGLAYSTTPRGGILGT